MSDDATLPSPESLGLTDPAQVQAVRAAFDPAHYLQQYPDVAASGMDPFVHYAQHGWVEGRRPNRHFQPAAYERLHAAEIPVGQCPFAHHVLSATNVEPTADQPPPAEGPDPDHVHAVVRAALDRDFYLGQVADLAGAADEAWHYLELGWLQSLDPAPDFSTQAYLRAHADVARSGINPFFHFLAQGRQEGRASAPSVLAAADDRPAAGVDSSAYELVRAAFDEAFYRSRYGDVPAGTDAVVHYLTVGVHKQYDPSPEFSTGHYLRTHADVRAAGVNPFHHYLAQGRTEGRVTRKSSQALHDPAKGPRPTLLSEHQRHCAPGPHFEEFDPAIAANRKRAVKALAFYLPQFHAFEQNDEWWGKGFTEWRNTSRGLPRYVGHAQPRIPRDLGFYDLTHPEVMKAQVALAQAAGLHGFCFYYYSFNGQRLLHEPVERFLADPSVEMPFLLIWANENWTKTWDGLEKSVLMSQDYRDEDEDGLLADLARHFADPRYIRVDGRPLFVLYRPSLLPQPRQRFARWRQKWRDQHGVEPLLFMAQGFGDTDPGAYGLDGAMEFPPHKVAAGLPPLNHELDLLDEDFSGNVLSYEQMVQRSLAEPAPEFPLIKGVTLAWDNEARRPGRGMSFLGATPAAYESWLRGVVAVAQQRPVQGESFVVINAWNEWAEGTYLEPDVHHGAAFLNATARAVCQVQPKPASGRRRVVLVGHDAYRHGAQILLLHIGEVLLRQFDVEVRFLILGDGPMLADYRALAPTSTAPRRDPDAITQAVQALRAEGFDRAIVNTTVSGAAARALHAAGIGFVSLIHELPTLIREYRLEAEVADLQALAAHLVFPAAVVRDGFLGFGERPPVGEVHVRPQGLYNQRIAQAAPPRAQARETLGLPADARVVMNVGYADSRKGFDLFVRVAQAMADADPRIHFIWVGNATADIQNWLLPDLRQGPLAGRFRLTGHVSDVETYYAAADVFLITSREDPFPSVVMEAMQAGLPVVGFSGSGGCVDLYREHGSLVERHDTAAICAAIRGHLELDPARAAEAAEQRRRVVREQYRFDDYCHDLVHWADPSLRKVSVVVPNYNYAYCLPERMDSIYQQSHPVFEVIVLDDRSPDDSVQVLREHAALRRRTIDLVVNEHNSGSVFRQWRKGAERARGEYLWIAEADDVAAPEFLEQLVAALDASDAAFAFCDSWQIDTDGKRIGESYKDYINDDPRRPFDRSFTAPGPEFARRHLAVKNSILNVSGVLWHRSALLAAMDSVGDALYDFRVAGDWCLYLRASVDGDAVAYVSTPLNGHRRHASSVTHALAKQRHFDEICDMHRRADLWALSGGTETSSRRESYLDAVASYLGVDRSTSN